MKNPRIRNSARVAQRVRIRLACRIRPYQLEAARPSLGHMLCQRCDMRSKQPTWERRHGPHNASGAHPSADRTAYAFRLAAKVELYESYFSRVCADWKDVEMWRAASTEIKEMLAMADTLTRLSRDIGELARAHLSALECATSPQCSGLAERHVREITSLVEALHRKSVALVRH
jgi:hypothetical protein